MTPSSDNQGHTAGDQMDQASQSLADALRVSFRLLTVIMIFVVVAFFLTGLKLIEPQKVGIKKVFGKVVGTAGQGLAYTWPFPVGQIELVDTSQQSLTVDNFWIHETAKERALPPAQRKAPEGGLRPAMDGALFTGDRDLLHVKFVCMYAIQGARGALACLGNIENVEQAIRAAVCKATILQASRRTDDAIQGTDKEAFTNGVQQEAQRQLDELTKVNGRAYRAILLDKIVLKPDNFTWPLRALPAYEAAQRATNQGEELRSRAVADARRMLSEATGENYKILVGTPEGLLGAVPRPGEAPYDLIGQYNAQTDPARAAALRARIERILESDSTGQAGKMIAEAKAYRTQVIQNAEARAKRFEDLIQEFRQTPQFMLERLWRDVRDEILSSPTIEKHYLTPGSEKMILYLNRDPKTAKKIQREELKKKQDGQGPRTGP